MKVIKKENKTIIDLTEDKDFNEYLDKLVKDSKRDTIVFRVALGVLTLITVLLLLLKFCK